MMRRFIAMPLFSVSLRWVMRAAASGDISGMPRLQPRHVELGGGQQGAEFVVQIARQTAALVFAGGLQVTCEFGQLLGAFDRKRLELIALLLQSASLIAAQGLGGQRAGAGT